MLNVSTLPRFDEVVLDDVVYCDGNCMIKKMPDGTFKIEQQIALYRTNNPPSDANYNLCAACFGAWVAGFTGYNITLLEVR